MTEFIYSKYYRCKFDCPECDSVVTLNDTNVMSSVFSAKGGKTDYKFSVVCDRCGGFFMEGNSKLKIYNKKIILDGKTRKFVKEVVKE